MFELKDIHENQDHFLFYKIVEKKYTSCLTKQGQIYFGLLENYRRMEHQNMKEIGDSREASLTSLVEEYIEIDGEYHQIHGAKVGYNARINANQCAFCCYYVGLRDFTKIADTKYQFVLSSSDLATFCMDKGGEDNCDVVIFDDNIVRKIYSMLRSKDYSYAGNKVTYDDYVYIPEHDIRSPEYALECTFHKLKKYDYQREFRITALNQNKKAIDDLFISVGDKDFSVIELKKGHNLKCEIELDVQNAGERIVTVAINIQLSLEKVDTHET